MKEGCKYSISCINFLKEFHVKFESTRKETKDLNTIMKSFRFHAILLCFLTF